MLYTKVIVDADLCIKLSASDKYNYLEKLLPFLADEVYVHEIVYSEIRTNKTQINNLIAAKKVSILYEKDLPAVEKVLYYATYHSLARVMMDNQNPNKNKGEVSTLAMAKTKSIPYFATDEKDLQPIIDAKLNIGIDDIHCIRIIDIINLIKDGTLSAFSRKDAKNIWILSKKNKIHFDQQIWPL